MDEKWEYLYAEIYRLEGKLVTDHYPDKIKKIDDFLQAFEGWGEYGWELVSFIQLIMGEEKYMAIFKRKKRNLEKSQT
jgi:hypothetical protein